MTVSPAAPAEVQADEFLVSVEDGSTIHDKGKLAKLLKVVAEKWSSGIEQAASTAVAASEMAQAIMGIRRECLDAKGLPMWGQKNPTDQYRRAMTPILGPIKAASSAESYKAWDDNVRQWITRARLEEAIVAYVLETKNGMPTVGELAWTAATSTRPKFLAEVPDKVKRAVAAEYKRCGLSVPEKFGGEKGTGGGKGKADPASPVADVEKLVESFGHFGPAEATATVGALVVALVERCLQAEAIAGGRDPIGAAWLTIGDVLTIGAHKLTAHPTTGKQDAAFDAAVAKLTTAEPA